MNRDYDIFEKLPDASVRCLTRVHGTLHVSKVLEQWGKQTTNECYAMNVRSRESSLGSMKSRRNGRNC